MQTHVFEAFKDYLNRYLDLVEAAEAETDAGRLEEIAERQKAYLKYRAEKDPARGMFTRMYGEEWTEQYIHGMAVVHTPARMYARMCACAHVRADTHGPIHCGEAVL